MTIPVTIIGGYLGAGKTTLINRLLAERKPAGIAVMVNDFGAINIDAELLRESADGRIRSFANGCICCSIGEDFGAALDALRVESRSIERVLVEASGVATPANLKRQCRAPGFHPHGCVVVVDAENHGRKLQDKYVGALLEQQIHEADWLHLNRTEHGINLVDALQPRLTLNELVHLDESLPGSAPAKETSQTTLAFASVSVRQHQTVEKRTLTRLLSELPAWIERAKGFVRTPDRTLLVQHSGGRFDIAPIDTEAEPVLVFIVPANFEIALRKTLKGWHSWCLDTP